MEGGGGGERSLLIVNWARLINKHSSCAWLCWHLTVLDSEVSCVFLVSTAQCQCIDAIFSINGLYPFGSA